MIIPISANRMTRSFTERILWRGRRPQPKNVSGPDAHRVNLGFATPQKNESQERKDEEVALSSA